jgi:mycothiol synthase
VKGKFMSITQPVSQQPQLMMLFAESLLTNPPAVVLPEEYLLRTYRPEDEAGYIALMHGAGFTHFTPEYVQKTLRAILPDGLFVIEHISSGQLVATAMATHNPCPQHPYGGELGWVAGSAEHKGHGLGRAVCAAVLRRYIQAGYRRIYLSTDDWRLPAIKVYLTLGLQPFLYHDGMTERWQAVCAQLNWPFTPDAWPHWAPPSPPAPRSFAGEKPIRVGVIGVGRGMSFASSASELLGMKLVALCDTWEERLLQAGKQFDVTTYTDYDRFLEHDMDAVVLANYFHQHAPFAIKALCAGKHVMSETSSNTTLAEGVALCRAVEETGKIYMLAENYPYTKFSQEMRRVYKSGELGQVLYAEGEYNHPMSPEDHLRISPGSQHWRNWIPSTYYCTHALAPLVYITETMPVKINALSVANRENMDRNYRHGDPTSVILCRMDNGAVFRIFGLGTPGHSNWYSLHGTSGAMEISRGAGYFGPGEVRVWHESWDLKPGQVTERSYLPEWPEHKELADRAGHGGGDFWTSFHFANAIRSGVQPFLDVYRGVAMSSVGILAWKSALVDGTPFAVPDFRSEASRSLYADDTWSPWPEYAGPGQPPPSILGFVNPSVESEARARAIWKSVGYEGE